MQRRRSRWPCRSPAGTKFNYYIDSVHGSDSNAGTLALPFATIGKGISSLATGQSIGLARGGYWREELDLPNGCVVGAYGSGAVPVVDASNVAANGSFSLAAGQTAAYQISWTNSVQAYDGKEAFSVWENGTKLQPVASLATCNSTAGSFNAPNPGGTGTDAIYVHASDSSNVATNGKTYEITARTHCILSGTGCFVQGLYAKRTGHNDGNIVLQANSVVQDCTAFDGQVHNVLIANGCTAINCVAQQLDSNQGVGSGTSFVAFDNTNAVASFIGCQAIGTYPTWSTNGYANTAAFYCHSGSAGIHSITFENCSATNTASGFVGNSDIFIVKNSITTGCQIACQPFANGSNPTTVTVTGCFFGGQATAAGIPMNRGIDMGNAGTLVVKGNVFTPVESSGGIIRLSSGSVAATIEYNTFGAPATIVSGIQMVSQSAGTLTFNNNILDDNNGGQGYVFTASVTLTATNNVLFPAGTPMVWNGTTYNTVALYQAASGQDANASTADPQFATDPSTWTSIASAVANSSAVGSLQAGALNWPGT